MAPDLVERTREVIRSIGLFGLALQVCLTLNHPLSERHPELDDCPTVDDVYFELARLYPPLRAVQ